MATENSTKAARPRKAKGKPRGRPFQKGQSGNPGGRPRMLPELRAKIQERGEELVNKLFAIAEEEPEYVAGEGRHGGVVVGPSHKDRIAAIGKLLAYGYGTPTQTVELSGKGGGPIQTEGESARTERRKLEAMTSGELRRYHAELKAKKRQKTQP